MADQYKVAYDLSIGAILRDLERPPNPHFKVTLIFDVEYGIFRNKIDNYTVFRKTQSLLFSCITLNSTDCSDSFRQYN